MAQAAFYPAQQQQKEQQRLRRPFWPGHDAARSCSGVERGGAAATAQPGAQGSTSSNTHGHGVVEPAAAAATSALIVPRGPAPRGEFATQQQAFDFFDAQGQGGWARHLR